MNRQWELPQCVELGGRSWSIRADFRQVMGLLTRLERVEEGDFARGYLALTGFYPEFFEMPPELRQPALDWMLWFLNGGREDKDPPGPKLIDWEQDAGMIAAEINRVAGCEVRTLPFVHWWTFLAWFGCIGQGQLSLVVGIRAKMQRGKKLDEWERDYLRQHRCRVILKARETAQQAQQRQQLLRMLEQAEGGRR